MMYLLLPFTKHMASEVSAANLAVGLSCWLGSQPPQLYVSLISKEFPADTPTEIHKERSSSVYHENICSSTRKTKSKHTGM